MLSKSEINDAVRLFLLENYPDFQLHPTIYNLVKNCATAVIAEERSDMCSQLNSILEQTFLREHITNLVTKLEEEEAE